MTDHDRIKQMAMDAGLNHYDMRESPKVALNNLTRFAALVAEDCAKIVHDNALACADGGMLQTYLASNAAAIRARYPLHSEAPPG
jgi:hypothetical protein